MTRYYSEFLDQSITYLKGVGPKKAELLQKERGIFTFGDLLYDFPFRHEDRTKVTPIHQLHQVDGPVQVRGKLGAFHTVGQGRGRRLTSYITDETGTLELVWFRGIKWVKAHLKEGQTYLAYGKVNNFRGKLNIPHPELTPYHPDQLKQSEAFAPVYNSTEKLNQKGLDHKGRRKIIKNLLAAMTPKDIRENLPPVVEEKLKLCNRYDALRWIHLPQDQQQLNRATARLKFEELFFIQWVLLRQNFEHKRRIKGHIFETVGDTFYDFYNNHLPFELTGAQKRVLKEIRHDFRIGVQMNRLLQGDVGSGKTIVALMAILIAIDNGFQACLMAPTEILARQHYQSLTAYLEPLQLKTAFLSGSIKGQERKEILEGLEKGAIDLVIGTHALIEPWVQFQNLGLAITDEQHRFGVKQRASLWQKNPSYPPHVLVMTATPIPRTLAMTLYGDLDVSTIDELPPGRKPVKTVHVRDGKRMEVYAFLRKQIHAGRQAYVVFPLIEESQKLELRDLTNGYERLMEYFPRPQYQLGMVHGQMSPEEKEIEMQKFLNQKTQILVATTVIEVGVNVPNATVMLIENAERFGLSQLHQLRGRVGRGAEKSYCILMSGHKLSHNAKKRLETMCSTNDGFKIAEVDLELRGPGEIAGTRQSGDLGLKIAQIGEDQQIITTARTIARAILKEDPKLEQAKYQRISEYMQTEGKNMEVWSLIS